MEGGATRGVPVLVSDARIRIRALTEIAIRCIGDLASTSREDKDPKEMTHLVKWLVMELRALGNQSGCWKDF